MFRFTVPLHSLACGIILVSKLYYVHYHPCPNPRKHAILTREKKNFVIPTVVMAHQKRFQMFLTSGERRPLVKATTVRAKEVRDMDAGPSHSRPVVSRACLWDCSSPHWVW